MRLPIVNTLIKCFVELVFMTETLSGKEQRSIVFGCIELSRYTGNKELEDKYWKRLESLN